MRRPVPITTLFLDIGGVLLTNGWDHHARRRAAKNFNLKWAEMEDRHGLNFAAHEEGRVTFEEYLNSRDLLQETIVHPVPISRFSCSRNRNLTPR